MEDNFVYERLGTGVTLSTSGLSHSILNGFWSNFMIKPNKPYHTTPRLGHTI